VNLALAIVFLWLGCALLAVAFHPLTLESAKGGPRDVWHALQAKIAAQNSAYDSEA
jgi:hypothetical protein